MNRAALILLLSACSETLEPPESLCGAADLIAMTRFAGGNVGDAALLYENGGSYVFVDAHCNYWVNDSAWDGTRTGTLDLTTAMRLGDALRLNMWPDFYGQWHGSGYADAPSLVFDDSTRAIGCSAFCMGEHVPAVVQQMRDAFPLVVAELWAAGVSAPSAVRAVAFQRDEVPNVSYVEWPLARPISDFVRMDSAYGEGVLEEDAAAVLKELRASFVRGDHGPFRNTLDVTSGGSYYEVYVRDALPFEDETGIVRLSSF